MTTFLLLLAADILLVALIIFLILYIRKLRTYLKENKVIMKANGKGYALLMDFKWWACLFIEMVGAFIWGIIGAMFNLAVMLIKFVFNGFPDNKIPQPQAYDKSIPEDKGF